MTYDKEIVEVIEKFIVEGHLESVLLPANGFLHCSVRNNAVAAINVLVQAAKGKNNNCLKSLILGLNKEQKTALVLALESSASAEVISALLRPLVEEERKDPDFYPEFNNSLWQLTEHSENRIITSSVNYPTSVSSDGENIVDKEVEKKKRLKDAAKEMQSDLFSGKDGYIAKFSEAINLLVSFLNLGFLESLPDNFKGYNQYFKELTIFLLIINKISIQGKSLSETAILISTYKDNSFFSSILLAILELLMVYKQDGCSISSIIKPIMKIALQWVENFGEDYEKELAQGIKLEGEMDSTSKQWSDIPTSFKSTTISSTEELLSEQVFVSIEKKYHAIAEKFASGKANEARKEFVCMMYFILSDAEIYEPSKDLEDAINQVASTLSNSQFEKKGKQQIYKMLSMTISKISAIRPNQEADDMAFHLSNAATEPDFHKTIAFAIMIFSRCLVRYGISYESSAFSYAGVFGLLASEIYSTSRSFESEHTVLKRTSTILQGVQRFLFNLRDFSLGITFRLEAGCLILKMIVDILDDALSRPTLDLSNLLNIIRLKVMSNSVLIKALADLRKEDEIISKISEFINIMDGLLVGAKLLEIASGILSGKYLMKLGASIDTFIPGVGATLAAAIPGMTYAMLKDELKKTKEEFELLIKSQVVSRLITLEKNLSNQISLVNKGVIVLDRKLDMMNVKLDKIIVKLNEGFRDIYREDLNKFTTRIKRILIGTGENKKLNNLDDYQRFLDYLLFREDESGTDPGCIYSKYFQDIFISIYHIVSDSMGALNSFLIDANIPNVKLWLRLMSLFICYLEKSNHERLLDVGFDAPSLLKVFEEGHTILSFLKLLKNETVAKRIFNETLSESLDFIKLALLINYCNLVGIRLVGYGEDIAIWGDNSDKGILWRNTMKAILPSFFPLGKVSENLSVLINTTENLILIFGKLSLGLLEKYTRIHAPKPNPPLENIERNNGIKNKISTILATIDHEFMYMCKLEEAENHEQSCKKNACTTRYFKSSKNSLFANKQPRRSVGPEANRRMKFK